MPKRSPLIIAAALVTAALAAAAPGVDLVGAEPSEPATVYTYEAPAQAPPPTLTDTNGGRTNLLSDSYWTTNLVPLTSAYRVLDTRPPNPLGRQYKEDLPIYFSVFFDTAGQQRIANELIPHVKAVSYSLTITSTQLGDGGGGGFLTIFPSDLGFVPTDTSNINWSSADIDLATSGVVWVASDATVSDPFYARKIAVVAGGAANSSTHIIVDITGIYVDSTA